MIRVKKDNKRIQEENKKKEEEEKEVEKEEEVVETLVKPISFEDYNNLIVTTKTDPRVVSTSMINMDIIYYKYRDGYNTGMIGVC